MIQNRILVVDSDPVLRSGICNFLTAQGLRVLEADNHRDGQEQMQRFLPDAMLLDVRLPGNAAPQLLHLARNRHPRIPVVMLTGHGGALRSDGSRWPDADHVIAKPVDLTELHKALLGLLSNRQRDLTSLSAAPNASLPTLNPFLGNSPAIHRLRVLAKRVLSSESPILLHGETGSGKGVLAKWIHQNGPRSARPFLDLNCAGLSRELLESELFGHEKGAFTSAISAKQGLLEVANHGTVFLDEIGDIDLQVQPKLLKVLEERVFRRLGGIRDRAVDIRLISATHRELLELVQQRTFRSDLYFRVNIVYLQVPSLRERVQDIPILAQHLLSSVALGCGRRPMQIAPSAMAVLQRYSWPGNIRELRNVLERAALIAERDVLEPEHLHMQATTTPELLRVDRLTGTLKQMECAYISHVLQDERGSIERAARRLGIPRSSLYNKMRRFEIPQGTGRA